jgi:hypothetical protein
MPAPRDIVDLLECVISIYFSDVRQKVRAAFILQDELVEMCCKVRARTAHPTLGKIYFVPLLKLPVVGLDPTIIQLGATLEHNHETRNELQHGNAAFTVDDQRCADAILDTVQAIEHCFPDARATLPDALKLTLRVVHLHSSQGSIQLRARFEDEMRRARWNPSEKRALRRDEVALMPGNRRNWGLVMLSDYSNVEAILNKIGVQPWP